MTEIRHGTLNGYSNQGCRCEACRYAHRKYQAAKRDRDGYQETYYRQPPRLLKDGKLCCLICLEPYIDHPLTKSCYRELAKT